MRCRLDGEISIRRAIAQNREEVLLAAALELPADKRPALLDALCAGAPLRQRLETCWPPT